MASVPNMRLTPAPDGKGPAASADTPEADLFARLMATPDLGANVEAAASLPLGDPLAAPAKPTAEGAAGDEATAPIDLALPAQPADFLPLIEAQAAAPVAARPALPTDLPSEQPAATTNAEIRSVATLPATALAQAPTPLPATPAPAMTALAKPSTVLPATPTPTAPTVPGAPASTLPSAAPALAPRAAIAKAPANSPPTSQRPAGEIAVASVLPGVTPGRVQATRAAAVKSAGGQAKTAEPVVAPEARTPIAQLVAALATTPATRARAAEAARPGAEAAPAAAPQVQAPVQAPVPNFGFPVASDPVPPTATPAGPVATSAAAEPAIERELDLAHDAEWLDRLARDIAGAGERDAPMRFRLHPQTLGHLRVEISQSELGTSVRLTADSEAARAILVDAQPRLMAEARAQGLRISESHVDLAGSGERGTADSRRQEGERPNVTLRTARGAGEEAEASTATRRDTERYA